uniref:Uncharacterized protein n=1 Tax=Romanomermis culicivorax TaxID=13658 RepID=A0A915JHW4_ROMCU
MVIPTTLSPPVMTTTFYADGNDYLYTSYSNQSVDDRVLTVPFSGVRSLMNVVSSTEVERGGKNLPFIHFPLIIGDGVSASTDFMECRRRNPF